MNRLPSRMVAKISPCPTTGCWLWTGASMKNGYGTVWFNGKLAPAHRAIFALLRGHPLKGGELDHLCRVRCCVNPDHLEPVSRRENIARSRAKGSAAMRANTCHKGHCDWWTDARGSRHCRVCARERSAAYRASGSDWVANHRDEDRARKRARYAERKAQNASN